MNDRNSNREEQFIIVAPIGRDASLIADQLARAGMSSRLTANDLSAVADAESGTAGIIITEEAITPAGLREWERFVRAQPPWSDLPFLLLGKLVEERVRSEQTEKIRRVLGNVTVLDRPLRVRLLLSAAASALRARRRQFEMRDAMIAQHESERALRQAEKLAVAGRLAATISHEINNPLNAVVSLVYLAEESTSDLQVRQYLSRAQEELRRVSVIVQETLGFHRAPTKPAQTKIGELLDSGVALFRHRLERRNVEVVQKYDRNLVAHCSSGEMRQVMVNLIGNAVDAMPNGGTLRVSAKRLSLRNRDGVMIYVADTGTGIPEDVRTRLFQQFFTTKEGTGTGLGLWLTRDIISRNRGRIRLRSRTSPPSGSIFAIWMPAAPAQVEASAEAVA